MLAPASLQSAVWETTAVNGTGNATLLGAKSGYRSFSTFGNNNWCPYCIRDVANNLEEFGLGQWQTGGTLVRVAGGVAGGTAGAGALTSFVGATADVISDVPAEFQQMGLFANRPAEGIPGRFYYATDTNAWYYDNGTSWVGAGAGVPCGSSLLYAATSVPAGNTVANTNAATAFTSSYTIPANYLQAGNVLRIRLYGLYGTAVAPPTLTLIIQFGSTTLVTTGAITLVGSLTNAGWSAEALITVDSVGSSGALESQGFAEFETAATAALSVNMENTATIAVNTTITEAITATVTWSAASASNTITLREMTVEVLSPQSANNGLTGLGTVNAVPYFDTTTDLKPVGPGALGSVLTGQGASAPPQFATPYVGAPGGRLTAQSNTAVPSTDQTAATVLYYVPYVSQSVPINWTNFNLTLATVTAQLQILLTDTTQTGNWSNASKTISGLTSTAQLVRGMQVTGTNIAANSVIASIPSATSVVLNNTPTGTGTAAAVAFKLPPSSLFDVFAVATSANTFQLQFGDAWTNSTTRADLIGNLAAPFNGIWANSSTINSTDSNSINAVQLYLGTISTTATAGQTEDSKVNRLVWNYYNRKPRPLQRSDPAASWTYGGNGTLERANANAANQVNGVVGIQEAELDLSVMSLFVAAVNALVAVGIGEDSTTAVDSFCTGGGGGAIAGSTYATLTARLNKNPVPGFHHWTWLETTSSATAGTFYGTEAAGTGSPPFQSGLSGWIEG